MSIASRGRKRKREVAREWASAVTTEQAILSLKQLPPPTPHHQITDEMVRSAIAGIVCRGPWSLEIRRLLDDLAHAFPGEVCGTGLCPVALNLTRRILLPRGLTIRCRYEGAERFFRVTPVDYFPPGRVITTRQAA